MKIEIYREVAVCPYKVYRNVKAFITKAHGGYEIYHEPYEGQMEKAFGVLSSFDEVEITYDDKGL